MFINRKVLDKSLKITILLRPRRAISNKLRLFLLPLLPFLFNLFPGFFARLHRFLKPRHELGLLSAPGEILLPVLFKDYADPFFVNKPANDRLLREGHEVRHEIIERQACGK